MAKSTKTIKIAPYGLVQDSWMQGWLYGFGLLGFSGILAKLVLLYS